MLWVIKNASRIIITGDADMINVSYLFPEAYFFFTLFELFFSFTTYVGIYLVQLVGIIKKKTVFILLQQ